MCSCASSHLHSHPCHAPECCPFFDSLFLTLFLSVCFSYLFFFFFYLNLDLYLFLHVDVIEAISRWHSANWSVALWPELHLSQKVHLPFWKVSDSWVAYHGTLSRQNLYRFLGRAQKFWNQFDEYDSRALHCVKQTSEKKKVRRTGKYKSKFLISEVPSLWNLRSDLQKRLQDKSDVPAEMRGNLPGKSLRSKKKEDKATFSSPSGEWILPAASTINPWRQGERSHCWRRCHSDSGKRISNF